MMTLEDCRHFYAEEVRWTADLSLPALVEAYARVPREKYKPLQPDRKGQVSCLGREGRMEIPGGLYISDPGSPPDEVHRDCGPPSPARGRGTFLSVGGLQAYDRSE